MFSDSQNSPSLVVPSPVETYTTSSSWNPSVMSRSFARSDASAAPTAWRNCVPVGDDDDDDVERLVPPVARHLPPAGVRIDRRADRLVQHLGRRHAERRQSARSR